MLSSFFYALQTHRWTRWINFKNAQQLMPKLKLNETISDELLSFRYSIIIRANTDSTENVYNYISKIRSPQTSFVHRIYVLHNFSSPSFDDLNHRVPIFSINKTTQDIRTKFLVPSNLRSEFVFLVDDDVVIDTHNNHNIFEQIFIKLSEQPDLYKDKILSPFSIDIGSNDGESQNIFLTKFLFTSAYKLAAYNAFNHAVNQDFLASLGPECTDTWFNYVISKFFSGAFVGLSVEKTKFSFNEKIDMQKLLKCKNAIKNNYPHMDLQTYYDVLNV